MFSIHLFPLWKKFSLLVFTDVMTSTNMRHRATIVFYINNDTTPPPPFANLTRSTNIKNKIMQILIFKFFFKVFILLANEIRSKIYQEITLENIATVQIYSLKKLRVKLKYYK